MNSYGIGIALVVVMTLMLGVALGLRYSQATLLFGFVAACAAPLTVHRIPDYRVSLALLLGLAIFASFPLRMLLQIDGLLQQGGVVLAYFAALWVVGFGWTRSWR